MVQKLIVITSNRDTILKEYADACIFMKQENLYWKLAQLPQN